LFIYAFLGTITLLMAVLTQWMINGLTWRW
jgi:hypothetical protein